MCRSGLEGLLLRRETKTQRVYGLSRQGWRCKTTSENFSVPKVAIPMPTKAKKASKQEIARHKVLANADPLGSDPTVKSVMNTGY